MARISPRKKNHQDSRFAGRALRDLFGVEIMHGNYDGDVWDLAGHPGMADGSGKRRVYFDLAPAVLRDPLKEFLLLATRPQVHAAAVAPDLLGLKPKSIKTVIRMLPGLIADLSWLSACSPSQDLHGVNQRDLDGLLLEFNLDHRRTSALISFGQFGRGMSDGVDRLQIRPWSGRSGLSVAGGLPSNAGRNTTRLFGVDAMWPWLETAMLLVERGQDIIDVANHGRVANLDVRSAGAGKPVPGRHSLSFRHPDGRLIEWFGSDCTLRTAQKMTGFVAAACAFVTVAFTGMRASEFEAIPRYANLDAIELYGTRRWLLASYLVKGHSVPRREQWLIPPLVADAVRLMQCLLDKCDIGDDVVFAPTGELPLFDRRALASLRRSSGSAVMRLERAIDRLKEANEALNDLGLVARHGGVAPSGRALRRNLTIVVASREGGAQAAMEQFKWQSPETASGYFRVAPEAIAVGQRQVFHEVAELHTDLVVDALRNEFEVWESRVSAEASSGPPIGQDGRRKRDMFAAVHRELMLEPRVEEDDRRLRSMLRAHAENMHLTEFGWCDWDEKYARCGGIGGPRPSQCDPYTCLNHSTPSTAISAHVVKRDGLLRISTDRTFPLLARDRARAGAEAIADHLGIHAQRNG